MGAITVRVEEHKTIVVLSCGLGSNPETLPSRVHHATACYSHLVIQMSVLGDPNFFSNNPTFFWLRMVSVVYRRESRVAVC